MYSEKATPMPITLPVEILDDIIGEACKTLDTLSISYIALTSHNFRIHANKSRFKKLVPHRAGASHRVRHTGRRIISLANVIRSGHALDRLPGLCSFATSFELRMIGFHDYVMPALEDGNLAYILNNLFRPTHLHDRSFDSSTIRSLSLYIYRWRRDSIDNEPLSYDGSQNTRYDGLIWSSLNTELLQALENLLRFSQLNQLCLDVMRGLPRDFLRGSGIRHLYLRRSSVGLSRSRNCLDDVQRTDGEEKADFIPLESLDIDGSVSCADLELVVTSCAGIPTTTSSTFTFPFLTKLSMDITYTEQFAGLNEILGSTVALRELSARLLLSDYVYATDWKGRVNIKYDHLLHLQLLSLTDGGRQQVDLITHLLRNVPQSVNRLGITFILPSANPPAISTYISVIPFETLDKHLVHPSLAGISHTTIGFEVDILDSRACLSQDYVDRVCGYIPRRLPSLAERLLGGLEINFIQKLVT